MNVRTGHGHWTWLCLALWDGAAKLRRRDSLGETTGNLHWALESMFDEPKIGRG